MIEREGEFIRIEQIAALIADLALKPFSSTHRVWVIVEPERMNVEAANTFLKSLEEPPADVHFILVSNALERVLETIRSRCQPVEFQPVADDELIAWLGARESLDEERATVVARLAHGSLERALRLLADERGPRPGGATCTSPPASPCTTATPSAPSSTRSAAPRPRRSGQVEAEHARRRDELERTVSDERERAFHGRRLDALQRREQARVSRLAALDALDHLASFLRDVWAVGLGAAGAVSNRDRLAELEHAAVARPDICVRLLEVVGRTRTGSVPERRPQARSAGDVCPVPGGLGKCLRSSTSSSRTAARIYHFDPGSLELAVGDQVVVETTRGADLGRVVEGAREAAEGELKQGLRRVLRAASAADLSRSPTTARVSARPCWSPASWSPVRAST